MLLIDIQNLKLGEYVIASITFVVAVVSIFAILALGHSDKIYRICMAAVIAFLILAVPISLYGSNKGFSMMWYFLVPIISIILLGMPFGIPVSVGFGLYVTVMFYTPLKELLIYDYPKYYLFYYPLFYWSFFVIVVVIDIFYKRYQMNQEENEKELEKDGVVYRRHPVLPYAYELTNYDYLAGLLAFQKGYFYIQDISSMQVAEWAEPKEGDYVIDVCAAPGGKAIHLAEKLSGTGHVEARDLTEYKVALIEENIERSGLDNIEAVCQDATINDEASYEKADILIADLPCSGLGILGKKPDLKSKMTVEMAKGLADLQRQILTVVHNYVKPGGKLLYSTCTINREENEDNTAWFVENFPEFEKIREKQMLPGSDMGDGFYIAEFRKQ